MDTSLIELKEFLETCPYNKVASLIPLIQPNMTLEHKVLLLNFLIIENPQVRIYNTLFTSIMSNIPSIDYNKINTIMTQEILNQTHQDNNIIINEAVTNLHDAYENLFKNNLYDVDETIQADNKGKEKDKSYNPLIPTDEEISETPYLSLLHKSKN